MRTEESRSTLTWGMLIAILLAAGLAGGCRDEEQDRPIFEPGVYKGKVEKPLSSEQIDELNARARNQAGI